MKKAAPKQEQLSEDEWQRRAMSAAVLAARDVVSKDGINGRASIGSLSDIEWGWIAASVIFGWIQTKAEQAVSEGVSYETPIRKMTARNPEPWEAGAVASILPALGNIEGVDWEKPIGAWPKDQIISFAWSIYKLTDGALASRDVGAEGVIVRFARETAERHASANAGGPLMAKDEDGEIPF